MAKINALPGGGGVVYEFTSSMGHFYFVGISTYHFAMLHFYCPAGRKQYSRNKRAPLMSKFVHRKSSEPCDVAKEPYVSISKKFRRTKVSTCMIISYATVCCGSLHAGSWGRRIFGPLF